MDQYIHQAPILQCLVFIWLTDKESPRHCRSTLQQISSLLQYFWIVSAGCKMHGRADVLRKRWGH